MLRKMFSIVEIKQKLEFSWRKIVKVSLNLNVILDFKKEITVCMYLFKIKLTINSLPLNNIADMVRIHSNNHIVK